MTFHSSMAGEFAPAHLDRVLGSLSQVVDTFFLSSLKVLSGLWPSFFLETRKLLAGSEVSTHGFSR